MQAFYGEMGSRTSIFSPALNKCKNYCLLVLCSSVALSLTRAVSFLCQVAGTGKVAGTARETGLFSLKEICFARTTESPSVLLICHNKLM